MFDLHSHILHDVDDGSRDLADALEVARAAIADGITLMAATPHGRSSLNTRSRSQPAVVLERCAELQAALGSAGLDLKVIPGTEIYGEPGIAARLEAGELLGYAGSRAVLIEFPSGISAAALEQIIFEVQVSGRRVVLAHPERLRIVHHDPNTLLPLIERGVLMQLTADALLGMQGRRLQQLAEVLLSHGLIQLIASDAHGPHLSRMPNLGVARRRAAELVGAAAAERMTHTIPAAILADTPIEPPTPTPVRRRFGLW